MLDARQGGSADAFYRCAKVGLLFEAPGALKKSPYTPFIVTGGWFLDVEDHWSSLAMLIYLAVV